MESVVYEMLGRYGVPLFILFFMIYMVIADLSFRKEMKGYEKRADEDRETMRINAEKADEKFEKDRHEWNARFEEQSARFWALMDKSHEIDKRCEILLDHDIERRTAKLV